jgi:BSD domain
MLSVALKISKGASTAVTKVQDAIIGSSNHDPFDLSFLSNSDLSDARKEALYRMTMEEVFTTPFPIFVDANGKEAEHTVHDEDFFKELEDLNDVRDFLQSFKVHEKTAEITRLLNEHHDTLRVQFEEFVPIHVTYTAFWQRFFYRCDEARIERLWESKRKQSQAAQEKLLLLFSLPYTILSPKLEFIGSGSWKLVADMNDASTLQGMIKSDLQEFFYNFKSDASGVLFKGKELESSTFDHSGFVRKETVKLMSMQKVYTTPLLHTELDNDEQEEVRLFLKSFNLLEKTEEILELLEKYPSLKFHYFNLVPVDVNYGDFWQRFFYRCDETRIEKGLTKRDELMRQARAQTFDAVKSIVTAPVIVLTSPFKAAANKLLCALEADTAEASELQTISERNKEALTNCKIQPIVEKNNKALTSCKIQTILEKNKKALANCKAKLEKSSKQMAALASELNEMEATITDNKDHKTRVSGFTGDLLPQAQKKLEANGANKDKLQEDFEIEPKAGSKKAKHVQPDFESPASPVCEESPVHLASPTSVLSVLKVDWASAAKFPVRALWPEEE